MGNMKKRDEVEETTLAETGPVTVKTDDPEKTTPPKSKTPLVDELRSKLATDVEKLEAVLKQYREYHDKHVNDPKFIEARKKIKEINAKLAPLKNEQAAITRGSAGNKGSIKAEPGVIGTKVG